MYRACEREHASENQQLRDDLRIGIACEPDLNDVHGQ